ncbi:uncharacterized protein BP5553_03919 [Venustampulla echinocandica]|uniref:F-box domain-containing protein n=1 Tax=Venustampulla echinocandica TaxID=2656787 RepID=A0A370TVP3_9HELO|nr:uncharacterized protein BP5553_03919 [Venustampulla echinocandica]RDL39579.1 hypothetical protein BP5553_03919 [Venustampulla echinocandica]
MAVLDDDCLLSAIIAQVKLTSNSNTILHACLLVCRRWKDATLPYLYGTTVLTDTNFVSFTAQFNPEYSPLIKSLTLRFGTTTINKTLQLFTPIIGMLNQLTTFSLYPTPEVAYECILEGYMLTPLIKTLPESCINLELELENRELLEANLTDPHLCVAIRAVLPRMRHVRLKLDTILRDSKGREFMSHIRTMMPVVEGEIWKSVRGGARVPTALLAEKKQRGFVATCLAEKLQIRMSSEWRREYPKRACLLWHNEKTLGMSLLAAEKREGVDFLSQVPIVEKTPQGWTRNGDHREVLERE